jgi:O-antigen/teichoic acid export membrane protein
LIKNLQNIYSYSVLNFIDKGLIFLTPLIILKFFDDKVLYNTIEYVYSISTILVIFFDLGLKNYIFFYLKKSKTYNHDLNNINNTFYFYIFYIFVFLGIILTLYYLNNLNHLKYILGLIIIRILYLTIINFYKIVYRANDIPSKIFIFSIPVSLVTFVLLYINYEFLNFDNLLIFFMAQSLFLILYIIVKFNFKSIVTKINSKIILLKKSLKFTFPLMLSVMFYNSMMNYGKIYSFNFLNVEEMTFLSFSQRLFIILTFFHATYIGFFQKKIYLTSDNHFNKRLFINYFLLIILINIILTFSSSYISTIFNVRITNFNIIVLLSTHSCLWCFSAYFETYLTKTNNNNFIMKSTIFSMIVFIFTLNILTYDFLYSFCISLNLSIFIHVLLILFKIKKVGIKLNK